jgi:hypothetical protein
VRFPFDEFLLSCQTPALVHYSGYKEKDIIPVAKIKLAYILRRSPHENFHKKYAARRYMKASTFFRQWAEDRWFATGGKTSTQIMEEVLGDLEEKLPDLRRAAKLRREAGEDPGCEGALARTGGVLIC